MTEETALAVAESLRQRAVAVYYEYPGYLSMVPAGFCIRMNVSDMAETISIQSCDEDGDCFEVIDSSLPSDCADVSKIVDFLSFHYTQQEEILRDALKPYGGLSR